MYFSVEKHERALCNTDSNSDSLYDPREEQMEWSSHNEMGRRFLLIIISKIIIITIRK